MGLRTSEGEWTQQRKEQTQGEEKTQTEDTGVSMENAASARMKKTSTTGWALHKAEAMLGKTFTENLPKYQRSQTSS